MNIIIGALILWFIIGVLTSIVKLIHTKIKNTEITRLDLFFYFLVFPFAGVFWTVFFILSFFKSAVKWLFKVVW